MQLRVYGSEDIYYGGCHDFEIALDSSLDAEGIHISVPEDILIRFDEDGG
jgi:hypothetical protein